MTLFGNGTMITIDGSYGEGGGQILRTSLALAAITGTPVRIENIRARRPKPGLQRQHLAGVLAAARVCGGEVEGAELNSRTIVLRPQAVVAGHHHFAIGSAGSTSLVLQTVLPILLMADGPSTVVIEGGTHNPLAPPVEFLRDAFLPVLHRVGVSATVELDRYGFYPAGGGRMRASVQPWSASVPLELLERGRSVSRRAVASIAHLPAHVAAREAQAVKHGLHWSHEEVDEQEVVADGQGNVLQVWLRYAQACEVISTFGELRKSAEKVAQEAVSQVMRFTSANVPVGEHLADQLLLPLALGSGGRFRTVAPSEHARTNAHVMAAFLGPVVEFTEREPDRWDVSVRGRR